MTDEYIFDPDLEFLKGKAKRRKTEHFRPYHVNFPISFMVQYREVTMVAKIIFLNGIHFSLKVSRRI